MLVRDIEDWGPDAATLEQAREKLYTLPDAECVVVPLVQPRKIQGWWRDGGEEVVTLSPVYEVGPRQLDYAAARNAATVRAEDELQNTYHGQGTIAYSVVDPDGTFSTFEY